MKTFNISIVIFSLIFSAFSMRIYAQDQRISASGDSEMVYGQNFEFKDVKSGPEAVKLYLGLEGDHAAEVQLRGTVSSVCQVKGCWMVLDLAEGQQTRVTFKDYGFFVPTALVGKEVVVNGRALVDLISEEARKHYAKDAGKSEEEIRNIQGNRKSYSLVAEGVIVED